MLFIFCWLITLLTPAAHAADHEYEIDMTIPTSTPPAGGLNILMHSVMARENPSPAIANQVISSDWSKLDCVWYNNSLSIRVKGTNTTWPTSLPAGNKAVCSATYNSESYQLTVNLTGDSSYVWPSGSYGGVTNGFSFNDTSTSESYSASGVLPTGFDYKEGKRPADKAGARWNGVWCLVKKEDATRYRVYASVDRAVASTGTGTCTVKRTNGTQFDLDIEVD